MPEVAQYVQNFKITNDQLYEIITFREIVHSYEQAVCMYLKQNEDILEQIFHGHEDPDATPSVTTVSTCRNVTFPSKFKSQLIILM